MRLLATFLISLACVLPSAAGEAAVEKHLMESVRIRPCFEIYTDLGETEAERRANAKKFAERIDDTSDFFLDAFGIEPKLFVEYADRRDSEETPYQIAIEFRIWRRQSDFLTDFQTRYDTETIPGAFFGIIRKVDEYGEKGPWFREIGVPAEGATDEQILRHLYHEMGHLFMRTFMFYPVEVPSWIEEGTAELFQYRRNNGTDPEPVRLERLGWLYEMTRLEEGDLGASIDWADFIAVRNAHNLAFTHENPLRSTVQYAQCWSVMEFMVATRTRGRAFTRLLHLIKKRSEEANIEAQRKGKKGRAFFDHINQAVYRDQRKLFEKAYGRDVLTVEDMWKDWVADTYEKELRRNPELRYHRGVWHLQYRARFAKDERRREAYFDRARQIFREGIEETPDSPECYVGMGRLAMASGDMDEAGTWFAQANERGAKSFESRLYGGVAAIRSGRAADAVEPLVAAVAQRPTHFEANFRLGQALGIAGDDREKALLHLERAMDLKPEARAQVAVVAGVVAYLANRIHDAKLHLFQARNALEDNPLIPLLEAAVLQHNGETESALALLDQAAKRGANVAAEMKRLIGEGEDPELGFGPDGSPGVIGLTIPDGDRASGEATEETGAVDAFAD